MNNKHTTPRNFAQKFRALLVVMMAAVTTTSEAALLALADAPLYLITAVEPNILLTFDDSGSMQWGYMPDTISGLNDERRGCSSTVNGVYYNPNTTYDPPVKEDGTPLNATPTSFTAAYANGFNTGSGTVNLATNYRPTWSNPTDYVSCGFTSATATSGTTGGYTTGRAAFYFVYDITLAGIGGCPVTPVNTNNGCFRLVQHNNGAAGGVWSATQQQNFANWYSYYRSRNKLAKTAVGRAFSRFAGNVRVAAQHLHSSGGTTGSSATLFPNSFTAAGNPVRAFSGANRTNFFTRLYNSPNSGDIPLREAMRRAGEYVSLADPYLVTPGSAASGTNVELSCRQNFHVMMTDGFWNGPNTPIVTGNIDNTAIGSMPNPDPSIATTAPVNQFSGVNFPAGKRPYFDTHTSTLADTAFFYWSRDLRGGLINNVPPRLVSNPLDPVLTRYWDSNNDPATWQHMVNFTIGLGIPGTLTVDTATYNNLVSGAINWPAPCNGCLGQNIDDLWHAAINSRGRYFAATDPVQLVNAFTSIINDVNDRVSSASSVSINGTTLSTNSYVYQSKFNSGDWSGQLLAWNIDPATGNLNGTAWDAAVTLNNMEYNTQRKIFTLNPTTGLGIPFRWADLDTNQQAYLNYNSASAAIDTNGPHRLNWIRGDALHEGTGLNFRPRTRAPGTNANGGWLGDTVDSAPAYVGAPPFNYPTSISPTASPYSAYKSTKLTRTPIVYVGANDGMLHAFNANTGSEIFAYVPNSVFPRLTDLTNIAYGHKYFVNGNHTVIDAFTNGDWRTVLAGTLRKGGRGVYALDVSDPASTIPAAALTEASTSATSTVLWEFTHNNDADLGYTFAEPTIARTRHNDTNGTNGKWAVVVGNGYNSTESPTATGQAVAYVLFIEDGTDGNWSSSSDYVKLQTGAGTPANPNGLASPAVVDVDGDYIADYIYAGDLQGNLWRWDIRSTTSSNWTTTRTLVFSGGPTKPITSRPIVGRHLEGKSGVMVYFGTGKYIETGDAATTGSTTQTFYGIWDNYGSTVTSADLLQQTVLGTVGGSRIISDNAINWATHRGWSLDLPTTGERVVANSMLRSGTITFTTVIPSSDPCTWGGTGFLMMLDANNGGPLDDAVFDTDGNGVINSNDLVLFGGNRVSAGGIQFSSIPSMPGQLLSDPNVGAGTNCGGRQCSYTTGSDGSLTKSVSGSSCVSECRSTWRQRR